MKTVTTLHIPSIILDSDRNLEECIHFKIKIFFFLYIHIIFYFLYLSSRFRAVKISIFPTYKELF